MNFKYDLTIKLLFVVAVLGALTACNNKQTISQSIGTNVASEKTSNQFTIGLTAEPRYKAKGSVMLNFSVTNNTSKSVKILKWGTPFEARLTRDMFHVTKNGQVVPYKGIMIKRGSPQERDYLTIQAKQTLNHSVDISRAYAIDASGNYQVQYKESHPNIMNAGILKVPATNSTSFQIIN